jgi:hypothetical protein
MADLDLELTINATPEPEHHGDTAGSNTDTCARSCTQPGARGAPLLRARRLMSRNAPIGR